MPKKAPGKERKLDQGATRLLKEDLHRRPEVTYQQSAKLLFERCGYRTSGRTMTDALRGAYS